MESALYGIYALVVFVSEILLVRCAHSFDFWYVNNSCVNTVRQHFPWSILYISILSIARAWVSFILEGKRDSRRHSTTGFSKYVLVVGTSLSLFDRERA